MTSVKLEKGESSDRLIRRFIKKVKKAGIIEEVLERRYYKKASIRRKEKRERRKVVVRELHKVNNSDCFNEDK